MKELLEQAMKLGCKYRIRYSDYQENHYTIPVLLTDERIYRILNDNSISEVQIIIIP